MTLQRPRATTLEAPLVALAAAALLFAFEPDTTWWFPTCPLHTLTGWLCPLCGSLRAGHALLHGAPGVAFRLNPLITIGIVAAALACVHDVAYPAGTRPQVERFFALCFSSRAVALAILFGVIRNVPIRWAVQ